MIVIREVFKLQDGKDNLLKFLRGVFLTMFAPSRLPEDKYSLYPPFTSSL